jgi:hypothetical protein
MNFQEYGLDDPELGKFSGEMLPVGNYHCTITAAQEKQNSAGTGSMLALEFVILDGDYAGRTVYDNLNLNNPNQTAVNIARAALKSLLAAVGQPMAQCPAEILGADVVVKIAHRRDKHTKEIRQQVGGYLSANQDEAPAPRAQQAPAKAQAQPAQQPAAAAAPTQQRRAPVKPGASPAPWG